MSTTTTTAGASTAALRTQNNKQDATVTNMHNAMSGGVDLASIPPGTDTTRPDSSDRTANSASAAPFTVHQVSPAIPGGRPGFAVCRAGDIPEGGRKIVQVNGKSIGVFHLKGGRFHALLNLCPHQLAPLCAGRVTGTMAVGTKPGEYEWIRDGEIIRCPWHAWEFDIITGRSIFNPHKVRTRSYPVSVAPPELAAEGTDAASASAAARCDAHDHDGAQCSRPPGSTAGQGVNAEGVETYQVSVQDNLIIVHV